MKPILMNTEMVNAILAGRKTQTRRLIKPQPPFDNDSIYLRYVKDGIARFGRGTPGNSCALCDRKMPYQSDDVLYVRETWTVWNGNYEYKADVDDGYGPFCSSCTLDICAGDCNSVLKWRPSIHMPKEAARIFLRVTGVRVERLQDVTLDDATAEGCQGKFIGCGECAGAGWEILPEDEFADVWNSTIKESDLDKYGWDANPWVWVIEFERISKEEAMKNV